MSPEAFSSFRAVQFGALPPRLVKSLGAANVSAAAADAFSDIRPKRMDAMKPKALSLTNGAQMSDWRGMRSSP